MLELLAIILLPLLMALVPGRALVAPLALSAEEKLALSFGVSFFIYYLIGFSGYVFGFDPFKFNLSASLILFAIVALVLIRRAGSADWGAFTTSELKLTGWFVIGLLWLVCLQALYPYYAGGGWYGDWYEHYERMSFFLHRPGLDTKFLRNSYWLPARPPLFNVVCYYYQSLLGDSFWKFQVICVLLNAVLIFPMYCILRNLLGLKGRGLFLPLMAVFLLNPFIVRNLTYTWTKLLAVYYVLLAVYFYLRGRSENRCGLVYLAFALLAAGQLTHYLAVIYLVIVSGHFAFFSLFDFKRHIRPLLIVCLILGCILSTWYIWSIKNYGLAITFLSNTTYEWTKKLTLAERLAKDLNNLKFTFVPHFLITSKVDQFEHDDDLRRLYDHLAVFYSTNLLGALTVSLGFALIACGVTFFKLWPENVKALRARSMATRAAKLADKLGYRPQRRDPAYNAKLTGSSLAFWLMFALLGILLGAAAEPRAGKLGVHGVVHVTLQPPLLILLCVAIKRLFLLNSRTLRVLIALGLSVEAMLGTGVGLLVLKDADSPPGPFLSKDGHMLTGNPFYGNYMLKTRSQVVFLYDRFSDTYPVFCALALSGGLMLFFTLWFYLGKSREQIEGLIIGEPAGRRAAFLKA